MASKTITLFDLAKQGTIKCWSPNVWKARLVLNYKGMDYRSKFLLHDELEPTLKELDIAPNVQAPGGPPPLASYTVPSIQCPIDGSCVMDSLKIAEKLETLQPQPSLHLDTGLHFEALKLVGQIGLPLLPVFMPVIGREIIPESVQEFWYAHKQGRFGMSMDQFERERGGPGAWEAAQPGIAALVQFFRTHKKDEGPFVLGSQVSFADFIIVALMKSFDTISKEIFDRFMGDRVEFHELYKASQPWLKRDT